MIDPLGRKNGFLIRYKMSKFINSFVNKPHKITSFEEVSLIIWNSDFKLEAMRFARCSDVKISFASSFLAFVTTNALAGFLLL